MAVGIPFTSRVAALQRVERPESILGRARDENQIAEFLRKVFNFGFGVQSGAVASSFGTQLAQRVAPTFTAPSVGDIAGSALLSGGNIGPFIAQLTRQTAEFPQTVLGGREEPERRGFGPTGPRSRPDLVAERLQLGRINSLIDDQFDIWNNRIAESIALADQAAEQQRTELRMAYGRALEDLGVRAQQVRQSAGLELGRLRGLQNRTRELYGVESRHLRDSITRAEEQFNLAMQELNLSAGRLNDEMLEAMQRGSDQLASQQRFRTATEARGRDVQAAMQQAVKAAEAISTAGVAAVGKEGVALTEEEFEKIRAKGGSAAERAALDVITQEGRGIAVQAAQNIAAGGVSLLDAARALAGAQAREAVVSDQVKQESSRLLSELGFRAQNREVADAIVGLDRAMQDIEMAKAQEQLNLKQFKEQATEQQELLDFTLSADLEDLTFRGDQISLDLRHALQKLGIDQIRTQEDFVRAMSMIQAEYGIDAAGAGEFALDVTLSNLERTLGKNMDPNFRDFIFSAFINDFVGAGVVTLGDLRKLRAEDESGGDPIYDKKQWGLFESMMKTYETSINSFTNTIGFGTAPQTYFNTYIPPGSNGRLPSTSLQPIGGGHALVPPAATAFFQMASAAAAQGIDLVGNISDSYRDINTQVALWNRFRKEGTNLAGNPIPSAARPGTSQHGLGVALDIGSAAAQAWLRQNGSRFGWANTVKSEAWHWAFVGPQGGMDYSRFNNPIDVGAGAVPKGSRVSPTSTPTVRFTAGAAPKRRTTPTTRIS